MLCYNGKQRANPRDMACLENDAMAFHLSLTHRLMLALTLATLLAGLLRWALA